MAAAFFHPRHSHPVCKFTSKCIHIAVETFSVRFEPFPAFKPIFVHHMHLTELLLFGTGEHSSEGGTTQITIIRIVFSVKEEAHTSHMKACLHTFLWSS